MVYEPSPPGKTEGYLKSKFHCAESDLKLCVEEDKIYEKRMKNILTAIDTIMKDDYNKHTNYVFLQECKPETLLGVVANVPDFYTNYQILHKGISEFCLVVRKSAVHDPSSDIIVFDFYQNKDGSPVMSKYISDLFYSYDIEVNISDLKKVMCYIVKSTTTIFFNVHFPFGQSFIFKRQTELYNFMNAIVYSIRSIPKENAELREYQNYDIVFTGDFNLNMLQRFPQDVKRFGYPDGNMIPIFFTCNYIKGQKTIISTTYLNIPSARATNGDTANYNLTNIDFSILYPRIGDKGTGSIEVTILNDGIPKKQTLPVAPVGSVGSSTSGSPPSSSSSSNPNIPLYIRESDKLLAANPLTPDCECGHMLCKRYTILKNNNKVKDSEGVHSVMIFESADDNTSTNRKFRILLGKEQKDGFYCMNTIGGKADHDTPGATNCKICIIQNLIDEINEEAKL